MILQFVDSKACCYHCDPLARQAAYPVTLQERVQTSVVVDWKTLALALALVSLRICPLACFLVSSSLGLSKARLDPEKPRSMTQIHSDPMLEQ